MIGEEALLAYSLDFGNRLIPLRYVTIDSVTTCGSFLVIKAKLGDFARCQEDSISLENQLHSCVLVCPEEIKKKVTPSSSLLTWEEITKKVQKTDSFKGQLLFWTIPRISLLDEPEVKDLFSCYTKDLIPNNWHRLLICVHSECFTDFKVSATLGIKDFLADSIPVTTPTSWTRDYLTINGRKVLVSELSQLDGCSQ